MVRRAWAISSTFWFCHGTQTMQTSRDCHCLLLHERTWWDNSSAKLVQITSVTRSTPEVGDQICKQSVAMYDLVDHSSAIHTGKDWPLLVVYTNHSTTSKLRNQSYLQHQLHQRWHLLAGQEFAPVDHKWKPHGAQLPNTYQKQVNESKFRQSVHKCYLHSSLSDENESKMHLYTHSTQA